MIVSRSMQNTVSVDLAFPSKFRSFLDDVRSRKTDHGISMAAFYERVGTRYHRHKAISLQERLCIRRTCIRLSEQRDRSDPLGSINVKVKQIGTDLAMRI